jgi:hypothetical protein
MPRPPDIYSERHSLQTSRISPTKNPRTLRLENCISAEHARFHGVFLFQFTTNNSDISLVLHPAHYLNSISLPESNNHFQYPSLTREISHNKFNSLLQKKTELEQSLKTGHPKNTNRVYFDKSGKQGAIDKTATQLKKQPRLNNKPQKP